MKILALGPYMGNWENEICNFYPYAKWLCEIVKYDDVFIATHSNRVFLYDWIKKNNHLNVFENLSRDEFSQVGATHKNISQEDYTLIYKKFKNASEIGHELAMQVAAMSPVAVDKENVSQEVIDREIEIGKDQARQEGKPEDMLEKIAQGKLTKFFKEMTLLNQDFIKDTKKTVRQYIAENDKDLAVTGFKRLQLGA